MVHFYNVNWYQLFDVMLCDVSDVKYYQACEDQSDRSNIHVN